MSNEPEEIPEDELSPNDWGLIADYIKQEQERRKLERKDIERQWDAVDRQVRMENIRAVDDPAWWPETELPLQSETLELLTADARRLLFPADRDFFFASVDLQDEDLQKLNWDGFIGPELGRTPIQETIKSRGPQAFANELAAAKLRRYHGLYRHRNAVDGLNTEAFKYGSFIGQVRIVNADTFTEDYRGTVKGKYPALVAYSIRDHYLDDSPTRLFKDGLEISPGIIRHYYMDINDGRLAASGSKDPRNQLGGWKPENVDDLTASTTASDGIPPNHVELINFDGDLVVPRSGGRAIYLPNVKVTVAPQNGQVIRYRENEFKFNTYISGTYHEDFVGNVYSSSPLMKGITISNSATRALKEMMGVAAMNARPPVKYDTFDVNYAAEGGPRMEPGALWDAQSNPETIEVGSLPEAMAVYQVLIAQYQDMSGVTAPRLGQQTKSHQTAFAVDTEVTRGMVRTVDYVRDVMHGAMQTVLHMEYAMARTLKAEVPVFLPNFGGFVMASGANLPKTVEFEVTGAGTPIEERERKSALIGSLQTLIQLAPIVAQIGGKPIDIAEAQRQIAKAGGHIDTSALFPESPAGAVPPAAPGGPELPAPGGVPPQAQLG